MLVCGYLLKAGHAGAVDSHLAAAIWPVECDVAFHKLQKPSLGSRQLCRCHQHQHIVALLQLACTKPVNLHTGFDEPVGFQGLPGIPLSALGLGVIVGFRVGPLWTERPDVPSGPRRS